MSFSTGKDIHKDRWTGLPMGEDILERIKQTVIDEGQVKVDKKFTYEQEPGNNVEDMEIQKTDETVEDESEERLLSKLFKFDHEINYNDELSESEEASIEEEDDDVALIQ